MKKNVKNHSSDHYQKNLDENNENENDLNSLNNNNNNNNKNSYKTNKYWKEFFSIKSSIVLLLLSVCIQLYLLTYSYSECPSKL
jgi:hypothetical protein